MPQTPAIRRQSDSGSIDYTPGSAVTGGDVVVLGAVVAVATHDIAANKLGSLALEGVFRVPKITGAVTAGALIYWDPAGDPVTGTSGTGAATTTAGALKQIGYAVSAQASGDSNVDVILSRAYSPLPIVWYWAKRKAVRRQTCR